MISVCCPKCGRIHREIPEEHVGLLMVCSGCRNMIPIAPMPAYVARDNKQPQSGPNRGIPAAGIRSWRRFGQSLGRVARPIGLGLFWALLAVAILAWVIAAHNQGLKGQTDAATSVQPLQNPKSTVTEPSTDTQTNSTQETTDKQGATTTRQLELNGERYTIIPNTRGPEPVNPKNHRDLGIDLALPTYSHVLLMDAPNPRGTVVRTVAADDILALVDRTPSSGWYDVIDVRSGKEGWVSQDSVQITFTKHPERAAKFTEEYTGSDNPPEISVENASSDVLSLKVDGTFYSVQPNSSTTISVAGGATSYYATEPGTIPALGKKDFKRGYRYSWRFWVETSYGRIP
jgi:hypothetical protein